jgi:hypothetical protein
MSNKVWVIRNNRFGYDDEYYCAAYSPTNIQAIYHDEQEAKEAYKAFEVEAFRSMEVELEGVNIFCTGGYDELLTKLDDFVFEKTGEHFIEDGRLDNPDIVYEMDDDDLLNFIQLAEINQYVLVEFDSKTNFFVLWLTQPQKYYIEENYNGEKYVYCSQIQDVTYWSLDSLYDNDLSVSGSLSELSDQPILLKKVIESHASCDYNVESQVLNIADDQALFAINPLLKNPIFEVRQLTIEQIAEIEAMLDE